MVKTDIDQKVPDEIVWQAIGNMIRRMEQLPRPMQKRDQNQLAWLDIVVKNKWPSAESFWRSYGNDPLVPNRFEYSAVFFFTISDMDWLGIPGLSSTMIQVDFCEGEILSAGDSSLAGDDYRRLCLLSFRKTQNDLFQIAMLRQAIESRREMSERVTKMYQEHIELQKKLGIFA